MKSNEKKSPKKTFFFGKRNSNMSDSSPDTISPKKVKKVKNIR